MKIIKADKMKRGQQDICINIVLEDGTAASVPIEGDNRYLKEIKKLEREGKLEIKEKAID